MSSDGGAVVRRPRLGARGFLLVLCAFGAVLLGSAFRSQRPQTAVPEPSAGTALAMVPADTMLAVQIDIAKLRATEVGARLLGEGRQAAGIGEVETLCGADPMRGVDELVMAVPAADVDAGFGVFGTGTILADPVLSCAQRLIAARGGKAKRDEHQGFAVVGDATGTLSAVVLAISANGQLVLAEQDYLQAALSVIKNGAPSLAQQPAHRVIRERLGPGLVVATAVLSSEQRASLQHELAAQKMAASPFASVLGGGGCASV